MTCNKKYDDLLFAILNNEGRIEGFLDEIFSFLYRRTDFFKILSDSSPNYGFPPGVAEKIAYYTFAKYYRMALQRENYQDEGLTEMGFPEFAQEVVIETTESELQLEDQKKEKELAEQDESSLVPQLETMTVDQSSEREDNNQDGSDPDQPQRYYESYSESYNGASCGNYCWSQTINDIDIQVKVPSCINSGKQVNVIINNMNLKTETFENGSWTVLMDGDLTHMINVEGSTWTLVPGCHIHVYLEKMQERWWDALLVGESKIDIRKIDASKPYEDLDQESQAKIEELMYNQQQKLLGNRTAPQSKVLEVLKEAWNNESSPFKGQSFDPNSIDIVANSDDVSSWK